MHFTRKHRLRLRDRRQLALADLEERVGSEAFYGLLTEARESFVDRAQRGQQTRDGVRALCGTVESTYGLVHEEAVALVLYGAYLAGPIAKAGR